tara:strand:+ start:3387 stop:4514 length:1128 start_codon:yes stop_codon:yes gene_type:complete
MAVQITPYRGSNPLKAMALGHQVQQGQQRLAQGQRQMDIQDTRNRLTQQQIDQAAARLKMTDQQFKTTLQQEIFANSRNAEEAIFQMDSLIEMDPRARAAIERLPATAFGAGLRKDTPADIQSHNFYLDQLKSDDPRAAQAAAVELGLEARPSTGGIQVVNVGGVPHIFDPRTGQGSPLSINGDDVTTDQVVGNKIATSSAAPLAKQAVEKSQAALKGLEVVQSNINNYGEAIRLLDEGASTGRISNLLPSVRNATLELENIQQRLGLNVIEQVTFGALSEGELDLALKTALPTGLNEAGLRDWLSSKMGAQKKLANELRRAAIYLGTPGNTVADYIKLMKEVQNSYPENDSTQDGKSSNKGNTVKVGGATVVYD